MTLGQVFNLECQVKLVKSLTYEKRKKGLLFTVKLGKKSCLRVPRYIIGHIIKNLTEKPIRGSLFYSSFSKSKGPFNQSWI